MTTPAQQYADLIQQSQDAALAAFESWTKVVTESLAAIPTSFTPATSDSATDATAAGNFDATEAVNKIFDFTASVLEMQRDVTTKVISTQVAAAESAKAFLTDATKTGTAEA